MNADKTIQELRFYIGNLRYALSREDGVRIHAREREFNQGRLEEAYEDALQMLTGNRGEDIR